MAAAESKVLATAVTVREKENLSEALKKLLKDAIEDGDFRRTGELPALVGLSAKLARPRLESARLQRYNVMMNMNVLFIYTSFFF